MEEKLQEILNRSLADIEIFERDQNNLLAKIQFCISHNLPEEERIARVKFDASHAVIYGYKQLHEEIQELLNKWES